MRLAFLVLLFTLGCSYETEEDAGTKTVLLAPAEHCPKDDLVSESSAPRPPVCFYRVDFEDRECVGATATLDDLRADARAVAQDITARPTAETRCTKDGAVLEIVADGPECGPDYGELVATQERPPLTSCVVHVTSTKTHDPLVGCAGNGHGTALQ